MFFSDRLPGCRHKFPLVCNLSRGALSYDPQGNMTMQLQPPPRDNSVSRSQYASLDYHASLDHRLAMIERYIKQGSATMQQVDRRILQLAAQVEQIEYRLNDHQARLERIRRVWLMLRAPWRLVRRLTSTTPVTGRPAWLANLKWRGMSHEAIAGLRWPRSPRAGGGFDRLSAGQRP